MKRLSKRGRYSRIEAEELLERHEQSGLSVKDFCDREGIGASNFYRWRSELSGSDRLIELIPAEEPKADGSFGLEYSGGLKIDVPYNFSSVGLKRLLKVLDR